MRMEPYSWEQAMIMLCCTKTDTIKAMRKATQRPKDALISPILTIPILPVVTLMGNLPAGKMRTRSYQPPFHRKEKL